MNPLIENRQPSFEIFKIRGSRRLQQNLATLERIRGFAQSQSKLWPGGSRRIKRPSERRDVPVQVPVNFLAAKRFARRPGGFSGGSLAGLLRCLENGVRAIRQTLQRLAGAAPRAGIALKCAIDSLKASRKRHGAGKPLKSLAY